MLRVKNIVKKYGKKQNVFTALDNVSFDVESGKSVAIVGKSGSGKSTLMHIMSGLDKPQQGAVLIDGKNILEMKARETDTFRAQKMSFVFQSFFVQGDETCYSNVSLSLETAKVPRSERKKRIESALRSVGLEDKIKERAGNLSGGQKQRLAVARAIVGEPTLLFADEPTGNLDSVTSKKIEDLLFRYSKVKGATLIIVTHDQELADKCDMQVQIIDGKVAHVSTKKAPAQRPAKRRATPRPVAKARKV